MPGSAGTNAIQVSWTGPDVAHQGSGLTSYAVTATATDYPTGSCPGTVTTSPCTISGLAAGVAYTLHVVANGPAGSSADAAGSATVTPIGTPAAPADVPNGAVPVGNSTASAGAVITITGSGFAPNSTVTCTFSTDLNGSYWVSVAARTEVGVSTSAADTTVAVSVAVTPDAPTGVTGKAAANAIAASWTAPVTVGATVTGYVVTASASGYPTRTCSGTITRSPCTISSLAAGVGYTLQVVATSMAGNSPAGAAGNTVVPTGSLVAPSTVPAGAVSAGTRTVAAGSKVSISGIGFKANTAIQLRLYPAGTSMGSDTATSAGAFSATVTIPKGTAGGTYTLLAFGLNAGNQARFVREGVNVSTTAGSRVKGPASTRLRRV